MAPAYIGETVQWLIQTERYRLARDLITAAYENMPPQDPRALDFLASQLHACKAYKEAFEVSERLLEILPTDEVRYNTARCARSAGRPDRAEQLLRQILSRKPDWLEAQIELAVNCTFLGKIDEGYRLCTQLLERVPEWNGLYPALIFNLGWHWMRKGEFAKGMKAAASGRLMKVWGRHYSIPDKMPLRSLEQARGRRVLMLGEGGAGDEILNARFAAVLKSVGATTIWMTFHALESILSRIRGIDRVVRAQDFEKIDFDLYFPTMDAVSILGLDKGDIDGSAYLAPPSAELQRKWRQRLENGRGLKVALRWQGNPLYEHDLFRSVPFDALKPLFDQTNVRFFSVQRDAGHEELNDNRVTDLHHELTSWEETAAALNEMDLVISSCTSVVHLAAAMGKPVWLLTPMQCYYPWVEDGTRSRWYSSVRLFRQRKFGCWQTPLTDIAAELERAHRAGGEPPSKGFSGEGISSSSSII